MSDPMRDVGYDGVWDIPDDVFAGFMEDTPDADCADCGHHGSLHYRDGYGQTGCGNPWCSCTGYREETTSDR